MILAEGMPPRPASVYQNISEILNGFEYNEERKEMNSIPNNRRDFLKWLGISSLSIITIGYGMDNNAVGSIKRTFRSFLSKEEGINLFRSFLNDDVQEIVHYAFWNNNEQKTILQQSCREWEEKLTQLKNGSIVQREDQSEDCSRIVLLDGTKMSFHLRYSAHNDLKGLTFFNGRKQLGILSCKESESIFKLYRNKSCRSPFVCCQKECLTNGQFPLYLE